MPKQRKERLQDMSQDETAQQLKALQDENLRLRIEVAYLKELRRLRLQEKSCPWGNPWFFHSRVIL